MKRLGEMLAAAGAANEDQRNRALLRQVRSRGRFGTALLEEGVPEEDVLKALSQQHHVPAAPSIELEDVRPDTARLIPVKLAQRLEVIPFRRVGRQLAIAMRNPQDLPALDEVATLTGLTVEPFVATEARIFMALSKYYGLKLEGRFTALARRIAVRSGERAAFAPDVPTPIPASMHPRSLLRVVGPPPSETGAYPARHALTFERTDPWAGSDSSATHKKVRSAETEIFEESLPSPAPIRRDYERMTPKPVSSGVALAIVPAEAPPPVAVPPPPVAVPTPPPPVAAAHPPPAPVLERRATQRRSLREAPLAERLGNAETRDEIAEILLEEASHHVSRAALFIVQTERLIGWASWPAPPDGLRAFELSFREASVFSTLRNTEGFYVGPYPDLVGTVRTLKALGSDGLGTMAVVPVNLKGKTVLFLYGESESYTRPPSVPVLKRLAAMAVTALEIILMKNRLRNL